MDQPAYFAVIPASVRYAPGLAPNAKLLYGEITALCHKEGFCYASNGYFARLYDCDVRTVQRWVGALVGMGFVRSTEVQTPLGATQRRIYLAEAIPNMPPPPDKIAAPPRHKVRTPQTKLPPPPDKNATHNNTVNETANSTKNDSAPADAGGAAKNGERQLSKPTPIGAALDNCRRRYDEFLVRKNGAGFKRNKAGDVLLNSILGQIENQVARAREDGKTTVVADPAQGIENAWAAILDNWERIGDNFLRSRTTLRHINDNFSDIIGSIRNGKNTGRAVATNGGGTKHDPADLAKQSGRFVGGPKLTDEERERLSRV